MSDYCDIAKPLSASVQDTTETLRDIERHNATWFEICGQ